MPARVTLAAVARAAGVSTATASYALRGNTPCAESTRQHVQAVAARLGYTPDPILQSLVAYRSGLRKPRQPASVVLLAPRSADGGRGPFNRYTLDVAEGVAHRAEELGYLFDRLHPEDLGHGGRDTQRALLARGVDGVILGSPGWPASHQDFDWSAFYAVSVTISGHNPQLEQILAHHYASARGVCAELVRRGYRRIGCVMPREYSRRVNDLFLAGFWAAVTVEAGLPALPPLLHQEGVPPTLRPWLRRHRPEVIVGRSEDVPLAAAKQGLAIPGDVDFASFNLSQPSSAWSGNLQSYREIGRLALNRLDERLRRHEKGPCDRDRTNLVTGTWQEGKSLSRPCSQEI